MQKHFTEYIEDYQTADAKMKIVKKGEDKNENDQVEKGQIEDNSTGSDRIGKIEDYKIDSCLSELNYLKRRIWLQMESGRSYY